MEERPDHQLNEKLIQIDRDSRSINQVQTGNFTQINSTPDHFENKNDDDDTMSAVATNKSQLDEIIQNVKHPPTLNHAQNALVASKTNQLIESNTLNTPPYIQASDFKVNVMLNNSQKSRNVTTTSQVQAEAYEINSDISQYGQRHLTMGDSKFKPMYQTSKLVKGESQILDENHTLVNSTQIQPSLQAKKMSVLPEQSMFASATQTVTENPRSNLEKSVVNMVNYVNINHQSHLRQRSLQRNHVQGAKLRSNSNHRQTAYILLTRAAAHIQPQNQMMLVSNQQVQSINSSRKPNNSDLNCYQNTGSQGFQNPQIAQPQFVTSNNSNFRNNHEVIPELNMFGQHLTESSADDMRQNSLSRRAKQYQTIQIPKKDQMQTNTSHPFLPAATSLKKIMMNSDQSEQNLKKIQESQQRLKDKVDKSVDCMTDRISAISNQFKNVGANAVNTLTTQKSIGKQSQPKPNKRTSTQVKTQNQANFKLQNQRPQPINIVDQSRFLTVQAAIISETQQSPVQPSTAQQSKDLIVNQPEPVPVVEPMTRVKYCPKTNFMHVQRKYLEEKQKTNESTLQMIHESQREVVLAMQPSVVNIESAYQIHRDPSSQPPKTQHSTYYGDETKPLIKGEKSQPQSPVGSTLPDVLDQFIPAYYPQLGGVHVTTQAHANQPPDSKAESLLNLTSRYQLTQSGTKQMMNTSPGMFFPYNSQESSRQWPLHQNSNEFELQQQLPETQGGTSHLVTFMHTPMGNNPNGIHVESQELNAVNRSFSPIRASKFTKVSSPMKQVLQSKVGAEHGVQDKINEAEGSHQYFNQDSDFLQTKSSLFKPFDTHKSGFPEALPETKQGIEIPDDTLCLAQKKIATPHREKFLAVAMKAQRIQPKAYFNGTEGFLMEIRKPAPVTPHDKYSHHQLCLNLQAGAHKQPSFADADAMSAKSFQSTQRMNNKSSLMEPSVQNQSHVQTTRGHYAKAEEAVPKTLATPKDNLNKTRETLIKTKNSTFYKAVDQALGTAIGDARAGAQGGGSNPMKLIENVEKTSTRSASKQMMEPKHKFTPKLNQTLQSSQISLVSNFGLNRNRMASLGSAAQDNESEQNHQVRWSSTNGPRRTHDQTRPISEKVSLNEGSTRNASQIRKMEQAQPIIESVLGQKSALTPTRTQEAEYGFAKQTLSLFPPLKSTKISPRFIRVAAKRQTEQPRAINSDLAALRTLKHPENPNAAHQAKLTSKASRLFTLGEQDLPMISKRSKSRIDVIVGGSVQATTIQSPAETHIVSKELEHTLIGLSRFTSQMESPAGASQASPVFNLQTGFLQPNPDTDKMLPKHSAANQQLLFTRLSDDPCIKYMRRLKTNDFWEKTQNFGKLLKQTLTSQYSQDYTQKCLISANRTTNLSKIPAVPSRRTREQSQVERQQIENHLRMLKYMDLVQKLETNSRIRPRDFSTEGTSNQMNATQPMNSITGSAFAIHKGAFASQRQSQAMHQTMCVQPANSMDQIQEEPSKLRVVSQLQMAKKAKFSAYQTGLQSEAVLAIKAQPNPFKHSQPEENESLMLDQDEILKRILATDENSPSLKELGPSYVMQITDTLLFQKSPQDFVERAKQVSTVYNSKMQYMSQTPLSLGPSKSEEDGHAGVNTKDDVSSKLADRDVPLDADTLQHGSQSTLAYQHPKKGQVVEIEYMACRSSQQYSMAHMSPNLRQSIYKLESQRQLEDMEQIALHHSPKQKLADLQQNTLKIGKPVYLTNKFINK